MSIAEELVAQLGRADRIAPLPRVRALHLPPVAPADGKDAEFCALELEDGSFGLSYVLLEDTLPRLLGEEAEAKEDFAGMDSLAVAEWYATATGAWRTIGFAAVNALTQSLFRRAGFDPDACGDSLGLLDPGPADHIGMIGLFRPLAARIVAAGARLTVVELRPELVAETGGYRITLDPAALRPCNKILSTSTVLLNDTLEEVLGHCRSAERLAMVGPGASCLPDALFARGVTLLGGVWVTDAAGFREALRSGLAWGRYTRKTAVRPGGYPGWDTLLGRLTSGL